MGKPQMHKFSSPSPFLYEDSPYGYGDCVFGRPLFSQALKNIFFAKASQFSRGHRANIPYHHTGCLSPPPWPFSVAPSPQNFPSLSSTPPLTVDISWLLPRMGGAVLASILRVAGSPLPLHRCRPIVLVAISLSSSNRRRCPQWHQRWRHCHRRRHRHHRGCVPLPHHQCCHCHHPCRWRHCCSCHRHHRHRRLSLSCLPCSLAVNPRNSTKASQGGIAHGMGMERLWIPVTIQDPNMGTGIDYPHRNG